MKKIARATREKYLRLLLKEVSHRRLDFVLSLFLLIKDLFGIFCLLIEVARWQLRRDLNRTRIEGEAREGAERERAVVGPCARG
jgi:hypothetical protein